MGSRRLWAYPPLPVAVPGTMGPDYVLLQLGFGLADEAAIAFQWSAPLKWGAGFQTKRLPAMPPPWDRLAEMATTPRTRPASDRAESWKASLGRSEPVVGRDKVQFSLPVPEIRAIGGEFPLEGRGVVEMREVGQLVQHHVLP